MKKSYYNLMFEKQNCVLCYNSASNQYIVLSKEIYNDFRNDSYTLFKENHSAMCDKLIQKGFLVDDDMDELSNIRYLNRMSTIRANRRYFLVIYPTQDCNLKCWYCYEEHLKGSKMSAEVMDRLVAHIDRKLANNEMDYLHVTFFGGEPLLYFDDVVYPLVRRMAELCQAHDVPYNMFFITNASLINEEMIQKLKPYRPLFQITLDGYRDKHDKVRIWKEGNRGTYDKIVKALRLISDNIDNHDSEYGCNTTLRINYDNETLLKIDDIINDIRDFDRDKFIIHLERVWQTRDKVDEGQKELLKKSIMKLAQAGFMSKHGVFSSRTYACPAEVYDFAVVNYDGLVYRCNGRTLKKETAEGVIHEDGTIEWHWDCLIRRLARPTFDNARCLKCKMLPRCMGPCSQKQIEQGWGNVDKICSLSSIDVSIADYLTLDFEIKYMLEQVEHV